MPDLAVRSREGQRKAREQEAPGETCHLCGLPVGRSRVGKVLSGRLLHFCCPGCRQVFQILSNDPHGAPGDFRTSDLYRLCVEKGIVPGGADGPFQPADERPEPESRHQPIDQTGDPIHLQELSLKIEGMWCPACGWLIEEVLRKARGILEARVFFLSDLARVKFLPQFIGPEGILERVSSLGYRPFLMEEASEGAARRRDLLLRLGLSAFLTANLMMISFALYAGFFQDLSPRAIAYLSYPIWLLATPVIFYGGFPILNRAIRGLRYLQTSMDTLISLGALSAYVYSVIQMTRGGLHLYFDTASTLVTLVLLGKYIELEARQKVSRGIAGLNLLAAQKVRLETEGGERWARPEEVKAGEVFIVHEEERIPIDGRVTAGRGRVDESILTGESRPVQKGPGDETFAGSLLLDGELRVRAARVASEGTVGQMIRLLGAALRRMNPMEQLADRVLRRLVPAVLAVAGGTFAVLRWQGATVDESLLRAVAVLVITCPCALGIAIPLAKVAAMDAGRAHGIFVQDPAALERARELDALVFDKTGTLTEGCYALQQVVMAEGTSEAEALQRVGAVESHSDHYLAREIVRMAGGEALERAGSFRAHEGMGVSGVVKGAEVAVGNGRLMAARGLDLSPDLEEEARSASSRGQTVVYFGWDGKVRGLLSFGDRLKPGAREVIRRLRLKGIRTWLVSGDAEETTRAVGEELEVDGALGRALPQDKVEIIRALQERGGRVGMVGDGLNDAAALAQAEVGLALGAGADLARRASDITLLSDDPLRVLEALDLSALTKRAMSQNLLFAFLYNTLAIPLAVAGVVSPLVAVLAMFASSLTVIGNTLRISRKLAPLGISEGPCPDVKRPTDTGKKEGAADLG